MCRLFFVWNDRHHTVSEKDIITFLEQSDHAQRNTPGIAKSIDFHTHMNGYGLGGFRPETGRWSTYKSPNIYRNDAKYKEVVKRFATFPVMVGHIRNTTELTGHFEPTTIHRDENTHPFYYKNHIFTHNGQIRDFHKNAHVLFNAIAPDLRKQIRGNTDTEMIFYLFLTNIRRRMSRAETEHFTPADTLYMALKDTLEIIESHFQYLSFNIVYANKTHALFTRYKHSSNRSSEQLSLYWNVQSIPENVVRRNTRKLRRRSRRSLPKLLRTTFSGVPSYSFRFASGIVRNLLRPNDVVNPRMYGGEAVVNWIITSEPIIPTQTLVPKNTLGIVELSTGNLSVYRL